jgi:protein gp37
MSNNTKIEWADHTFNPWEGCQKVGPGCDHCYAETRNARFAGGTAINWGPGAPRRRTSAANWRKPLAWNAAHAEFYAIHGHRQRVFCASLADVFDNAVDPSWRADLADLIQATPNLDWLLLTKRIGNVGPMLTAMFLDGAPPNVWLGATIANQEEADRDIPKLLQVAVDTRFLSMEPLLGAVDLTPMFEHRAEQWSDTGVDWVIVGGESGPGARPMHPHWARDLRVQCASAGVPFLFKQWGEWLPGAHFTTELAIKDPDPFQSKYRCALWTGAEWNIGFFCSDDIHFEDEPMYLVGKKAAGRELYGHTYNGIPEAM